MRYVGMQIHIGHSVAIRWHCSLARENKIILMFFYCIYSSFYFNQSILRLIALWFNKEKTFLKDNIKAAQDEAINFTLIHFLPIFDNVSISNAETDNTSLK